jgi:hypothetical protein
MERRLDHEQLSNALFALRADRLFAVTLAGDADAVEAVLADAKREADRPRAAAKALGDATADLTYTPINPCRILDTRSTAAGPLAANVARTFDGYSTNFASQGGTGSGCSIPNGVAALAMNVYAVNPTNLGFIKVWPASGTEPDVSTVNYQPGVTAIATGTLVPVDPANGNRFTAKSPATVDFIADVVGFFRAVGSSGTGLRIASVANSSWGESLNVVNGPSPNLADRNCGEPAQCLLTDPVIGAVIAGGGNTLGPNKVTDTFGTVSGGARNRAGNDNADGVDAVFATVSGGFTNVASGSFSTIAGGDDNIASGSWSSVGGGNFNTASETNSTIAGGLSNAAEGSYSTVGGGGSNIASGPASTVGGGGSNNATAYGSTVPGGVGNLSSGSFSFAAGYRALTQTAEAVPIIHNGAFVWSDYGDDAFHSAAHNEFAARTTGGVRFVTAIDDTGVPTWTCGVSGGAGGSWGCTSDLNAKTDLIPLDGVTTLERLSTLPVYRWVAKNDPRRTPHAGPTAQDFMAAFGLGDNDRMIGFADAQGVAFAAIQGLNAKLAEKDREIAELKRAVEILLLRTSPDGRRAEAP